MLPPNGIVLERVECLSMSFMCLRRIWLVSAGEKLINTGGCLVIGGWGEDKTQVAYESWP